MNLDFCVRQLAELIRRDYRVPRFAKLELRDEPTTFIPDHLSIKDCIQPLLADYEITKKREAFLIDCVKYLAGHSCPFSYLDNLKKQEFMNELGDAIPDVRWPTWYISPKERA